MRHYGTARELARRLPNATECEHRGRIKFFLGERGYGFIEPDAGGEDIFVHESVLADPNRIPTKGEAVLFAAGMRKGKYGATAVRVL